MNILLVGGGGREHALCWKLAQSPLVDTIYACPGNPGIGALAKLVAINLTNHDAVEAFCAENAVALVVIGPEAPLVDGLADSLRKGGLAVFGPSAKAARLEGSKSFTKALCDRAGIPTAGYARATSAEEARAALPRFGLPVVIKADGLAAGKGVIIAQDAAEAEAAIVDMFGGGFGTAGAEVVIEEFMTGEEASFFAITDGSAIVAFGSAQDHKRVGDGDIGPNTGGMGAYSPAPVLTPALETEVMASIIEPTVRTMAAEGMPYSGVLFAGLMLTDQGPKLIEYNCRFGDPECQVLMMRLESDLADLMLATASSQLTDAPPPVLSDRAALTVVMAANGYPGTPEKGGSIAIGDIGSATVFHAGTAIKGDTLVADGGRVLNVTATGTTVTEAQSIVYKAIDAIDFPSGFCRRDIGWREVAREAIT